MSSFLKIPYNMWHGVIPAIVLPLVMGIAVAIYGASQIVFMLTWISTSVVLLMLQGVNEALQLKSSKLIENYGSLENAQANSTDDWKFWLFGMFGGTIISTIIFIFIDKIF